MKVMKGKDSRVLTECVTCYACEEYCTRGNHPFYLISEKREEKGMFTAPRPITTQWKNMTSMQGKYLVGNLKDTALSCCYLPELGQLGTGEIFKDVASAQVFGAEFMCPAVHSHFARMSVIKERLPMVIENYRKLGVKEVICMHDECYGTLTSIASAYGIEVLFDDPGLRRIAERAAEEQTGARGLMTVCERVFRNIKFELPSTPVKRFVVTRELVDDPAGELRKIVSDPAR